VLCFIDLKLARLAQDPTHQDSIVDVAGYAAVLQEAVRWRGSGPASPSSAWPGELGVGIGIDSGQFSFGEFGRSHRDLTAIGTIVNTAARVQAAASARQTLVTKSVFDRARSEMEGGRPLEYSLKGFAEPVRLYAA